VDTLFTNQAEFFNAATFNMSEAQVFQLFAKYAQQTGVDPVAFLSLMSDSNLKYEVVLEWKMGASAGVYGTPFHRVNGLVSPDFAGWTVSQWTTFLNGLLAKEPIGKWEEQ
jgi:hypothetical protein